MDRPLLALLRRIADDNPASTILLAGELRRPAALGDSIAAIVRAGWSGELFVTDAANKRTFFIRDGAIIGATTTSVAERIGAVMLRMGVFGHDQLRVIVTKLDPTKRFGQIAIDEGLLTPERLFDVVRRQAEEILYGAFSVGDGAFALREGFDDTRIAARCHLDAREAVNQAVARFATTAGIAIGSIDEPVAAYNQAISVIHRVAVAHDRGSALGEALGSFIADSPLDRALLLGAAPDGRISAAVVAEALAQQDVRDPRAIVAKRLHEYLVYTVVVVTSEMGPGADRALLAEIDGLLTALTAPVSTQQPYVPPQSVPGFRISSFPSTPPPPRVASPEPAVTTAHRPRAPLREITIVAGVLLAGTAAVVVARSPLLQRDAPIAPASAMAANAAPPPSASPSASASVVAAAPLTTVGTVRASASGSHRVWIDGKVVGNTPQAFEVHCGLHVVRVGNSGLPQLTEVPCGGEVEVELR